MIHVLKQNPPLTMPIYGSYTTEGAFGKHLLQQNSPRKIQLISKCGIQMLAENRDNKIKHYDYSKSHIIWSVEQSLKNLKTDYLDVFCYTDQVH
jgi:predicted oxidoreductase